MAARGREASASKAEALLPSPKGMAAEEQRRAVEGSKDQIKALSGLVLSEVEGSKGRFINLEILSGLALSAVEGSKDQIKALSVLSVVDVSKRG
jgi:hypothetical protein